MYETIGEQMTEMEIAGATLTTPGTPAWVHTNVFANGKVLATYRNDGTGPHFPMTDWVGTRGAQTNYAGSLEQSCQSLPFGDGPSCVGATEQYYTGKERDTESGLDYFSARHYGSSMGRFMSPDPSGLSFANPYNPQSLNLYAYAMNNPLINTDPTGLDCVSDNGDGTASINSGDCPGNNPNSEYYYDCGGTDGCLMGTTSASISSTGYLALCGAGSCYTMSGYGGSISGGGASSFGNPWGDALFSPQVAGMIGNGGMQAIGAFTAGSVALGTGGGLLLSSGVIGGAGMTTLGLESPSTTALLQAHVEAAVEQAAAQGLTPAQAAAVANNPNLGAAYMGNNIDAIAKGLVSNDPLLGNIGVTRPFQFGPDFISSQTGQWWDVTTQGQWAAHVAKYASGFGTGTLLGY